MAGDLGLILSSGESGGFRFIQDIENAKIKSSWIYENKLCSFTWNRRAHLNQVGKVN